MKADGPPRRWWPPRAAIIIVLIVAALALAGRAFLVRVGEGERAFRVGPGGTVVRLTAGRHLVLPGAHRLERLPSGPLVVAGEVPLRSREGVSLVIPYEVNVEAPDAAVTALLSGPGGRAPEAVVRAEAAAGITRFGEGASGEALILRQGTREAEEAIARRLEAIGFEAVTLRFGKVKGPADLLASIESAALRDLVSETKTKVALIGLDGAEWEIIDPLIAKGDLPTLKRLKERGAWGNMKSIHPMLSPLLWTSVATGRSPDQHGIIDFLVRDTRTGQQVPISSRRRQVKALWNIFTDAGRSSAFVAWWATWPAEKINGTMVSDRVAYSLFGFQASEGDRAGATWPAAYFQAIRPRLVDDARITLADLQPFARVSEPQFKEMRARIKENARLAYREPVNHLTKILASARSYQAVALDLLAKGQPDLFGIYYQGIDEVCHRFAHFMPPKMAMASDEDYAAYKDTVFAYYRYQDGLLGELLARLSPDTTVVVVSDHGFRTGSDRPVDEPPYIEGKPALWHRRYGIVLLDGPAIRPGRLDTTELLDVAPTVLYLAGLPVPEDMGGRIVVEAIRDDFRRRFPPKTIPSYEGIGHPLGEGLDLVADTQVDAEMMEKLRSLGYIGGDTSVPAPATPGVEVPPGAAGPTAASGAGPVQGGAAAGGTLVTGYLNEAAIHIKNKDYARARALAEKALLADPKFPASQTLMAQVEAGEKRYDEAIARLVKVIEPDAREQRGLFGPLARYYGDGGRAAEGAAWFRRQAAAAPRIAEIRAGLGYLLLQQGDRDAAERELLESLHLDPSQSDPLTTLHKIYQNTPKVLTLEPLVRQGLQVNDKSVAHHNWMGMINEWRKDVPGAEREFRRALDLDPDDAGTMANLGALYGRNGRLQEAVTILTRSVAKDPENMESWVNLGAAHGRLGHAREAIQALETARRKGLRTTTLFNALALSYLQDQQQDRALEYLRESLSIDPNQKDARDLLEAVTRRPRP